MHQTFFFFNNFTIVVSSSPFSYFDVKFGASSSPFSFLKLPFSFFLRIIVLYISWNYNLVIFFIKASSIVENNDVEEDNKIETKEGM